MKFLKYTFDNYTNNYIKIHNNNECDKINNIEDFKYLIIYGRKGIGKYSEALNLIKKLSPNELKYEKKLAINNTNSKNDIFIKISDIHFEVDFQILGYNSKHLFNEIYNLIVEIICTKPQKKGIILCKNFEYIDNELLDLFYSYMKNDLNKIYSINFIILATSYSFLPNNIINMCKVIRIKVPAKHNLKKITNKNPLKIDNNLEFNTSDNYIDNLKDKLYLKKIEYNKDYLHNMYKKLVENKIEFNELRNDLYDLLIYKVDLNNFIWDLLELLIINDKINNKIIDNIFDKTFKFFMQYNNNYRPIFHLENYILYLLRIINDY